MRVIGAVALLVLAFTARAAYADPIPSYILDKDYQSCIGQDTGDAAKTAYCTCVRDTMRGSWSIEDYGAMAEAQMKNPNQPPMQLEQLAKTCAEKVLK
jgi:hypothetical protein